MSDGQAVQWMRLVYLAFLTRCLYEASTSPEQDLATAKPKIEANSPTWHAKLTNSIKGANVKLSLQSTTPDLPLQVGKWKRKELRRFREAQERKWQNWFKAQSK